MDDQFVISAYHNYIVNGLPVAGFQIGKAGKDRFFFHAPPVEPGNGKPQPLITVNLFDSAGQPLLEIHDGLVVQNFGTLKSRKTKTGLSIRTPDGSPLFAFETIAFRNSYHTRFAGTLYDEQGKLVASGAWKDFAIHARKTPTKANSLTTPCPAVLTTRFVHR